MTEYRVLITGSRDWKDRGIIEGALREYARSKKPHDTFVLISGACPTGADHLGEITARILGWDIETHPADWEAFGKRAGYVRNSEMVELGADACFAFLNKCVKPEHRPLKSHPSHGGGMTADMAEKAGIITTIYRSFL